MIRPLTNPRLYPAPQAAGTYAWTLKDFGIKVDAKTVDWALLTNVKKQNAYDMMSNNVYHRETPGAELESYWSTESALHSASSRNLSRMKNPAVDELIKKATNATVDREREVATRALDRLLQSEAPMALTTHKSKDNYMIRSRLGRSFEIKKNGPLDMYDLAVDSWWDKSAPKLRPHSP